MRVLIIGENSRDSHILNYFCQRGMETAYIGNVFSLRSLSGEIGGFTASTEDDEIKADFVVIAPRGRHGDVTQGDGSVVFLLDYKHESPMASTIYALESAAKIARKKRQVFYLARFIRTAGRGVEALYKEAREAGVTFIKYEDIQVNTDTETDVSTIHVIGNDKGGESAYFILTKTLFSDNSDDFCEHFEHLKRVLNLRTNKHGYLTEDMYFLAPALTNRRGVFHLTGDLIAERLDEGLDFIYASMCLHYGQRVNDKQGVNPASQNVAEIDSKKCVFCYNCYRTCTHAALEPDTDESQMRCRTAACEGCGICVGICPANAITLCSQNTTEPSPCVPRASTLVFCCENSAVDAVKGVDGIECKVVPCGGIIDFERLSGGLTEYDKIVSVVCPDDACRHFDGNKRACVQTKRLHDMLEAAGLESQRVRIIQVSHAMPQIVLEEMVV